jgi:cytochrome c peroxidase
MKRVIWACVAVAVVVSALCLPGVSARPRLTNGLLGPVPIPPDNPQTPAKIRLGQQLYFDPRLSVDNSISCATCHSPATGWAGHDRTDTGVRGQVGTRNSGTVLDAAYMKYQFWDGRANSLEEQALGPIHNPIEMGETLENVVQKLNAIPGYKQQFRAVFHTDATSDGIAKAIASFERTVISGPSPYDRYLKGEKKAMTPAAVRGMALFSGKARCIECHRGPTFSDQSFHNLGVGMDQPNPDTGRYDVTHQERDWGRFKTPMLRNVALTYPYLHNGSAAKLTDVVELIDRGGIPNKNLDPLMKPLNLTEAEKTDLIAFMDALTGTLPKIGEPALPK